MRPRTGSTFVKGGIRQIAVTTWRENAPKPRWTKRCPARPDGAEMTVDEARAVAREAQRQYDAGEWDPWATTDRAPPGETVRDYAVRWLADRRKRGLRAVTADESRLTHWVLPSIGHRRIDSIRREDVESIRDALDTHVRMESISWKTAENIWGVITKLFADACAAKVRALRVIVANPCTGVLPPDRGREKSKAYLYPSELLAFVACEGIDLGFRRLVAVACYAYMREGELSALEWSDIDLAHGEIHVHRARDGKTFEVRAPKTPAGVRTIPIESTLRPLLEQMHREAGGRGLVFPMFPAQRDASRWLREGLLAAGQKREALHVRDATRLPITFHDLRATGTTWCAVRGDSGPLIMQRAGHEDFDTTLRYIREAENRRAGFGVVFPELPAGSLRVSSATGIATPPASEMPNAAETQSVGAVPAVGVEPSPNVTSADRRPHLRLVAQTTCHRATDVDTDANGSATASSESLRGDIVTIEALECWELIELCGIDSSTSQENGMPRFRLGIDVEPAEPSDETLGER